MGILDKLMNEIKKSGQDIIPGSELFKLYDTYGFPLDLAQDIAEDNKLRIDGHGFNNEMQEQKSRARASWVGEEEISGVYREVFKRSGATEFLGYESMNSDSNVIALIKDGELVDQASEDDQIEIVLDRTPFYGESGGQVGDAGTMKADGLFIVVNDTKKYHNLMLHNSRIKNGTIKTGMTVSAGISEENRKAIKRNHTATHLLHAALKMVLGDHIKQAGSLVAADRLRFDFNHFFAVNEREIGEIEDMVNEKIIENSSVAVTESDLDDAISQGVVALFGEKYGEKVRVVKAGDFSAELCGGTHCNATGEIGPFKIISEGSVAAGIRRIEAVTGFGTLAYHKSREAELKKAAGMLRVNELAISSKLEKVMNDLKTNEKELDKIRQKTVRGSVDSILENITEINGIKVLAYRSNGMDMKGLRSLADSLKDKIGSGVIVLGSKLEGQAYYVSAVTKDLVSKLKAGDILKAVTGGKGGGRPDMAQGGTKDPEGLDRAISSVGDIIKEKVK